MPVTEQPPGLPPPPVVVAAATAEGPDDPAALTAMTRYRNVWLAESPVLVKVVPLLVPT